MMNMTKAKPKASLYVIRARRADKAVIFRRGPSKAVQLISWDMKKDAFESGQWFKGRIYERRCDLSPDGNLLIYFAATYKEPLRSWTAISKPPFFTALALWPKGDGWNGGGWFVDAHRIRLNHFQMECAPHPEFIIGCRKFPIESYADSRGEDSTVWDWLLARDGWKHTQKGKWKKHGAVPGFAWKAEVPDVWRKEHPKLPLFLEMSIEGLLKQEGSWYFLNYWVVSKSDDPVLDLDHASWADWDKHGDLIFARDGCLFRQRINKKGSLPEKKIADFQNMVAPAWAQRL